jgi:hypothetical protein
VLLPSAYSNVTKTAFAYAQILPEQKFLLVLARESAAVSPVPKNVETERLASFATTTLDRPELQRLEDSWRQLEESLRAFEELDLPVQLGILKKGRPWLRWGMTVRDAWARVFDTQSVVGCLSADDSNPYTRIPLLLAGQRQIPAVACHHGALDCRMAFKNLNFSNYLAKGEMESDYLRGACGVDAARIQIGAPSLLTPVDSCLWSQHAPWVTFFSEPYETDFWRVQPIYSEVLPRLVAIARAMGKRVMWKLHPFETSKQRRKFVAGSLNEDDQSFLIVTDTPMSTEILQKTWCAVTVESTVAFECASVGIPAFLCGWLRHAYAGYAPQYARFGAGRMLETPDDLLRIPEMVQKGVANRAAPTRLLRPISGSALSEILSKPRLAL